MASEPAALAQLRRASVASALAILEVACGNADHPAYAAGVGSDPGAYVSGDAGDGAAADVGTSDDAQDRPDFGPIPDVPSVDGPSIPSPPAMAAPAACTADALALSGATLRPSSTMPAAFVAAWGTEAQKAANGVVLLRFAGLASTASLTLSLGAPDPARAGQFFAGLAPATAGAFLDATTGAFVARGASPLALVFGDVSTVSTSAGTTMLLASSWTARCTLTTACSGARGVVVTLTVPASQGAKPLAGVPLSSLLGAPDPSASDAAGGPAWTMTLTGELPAVGG